MSVCLCVCASVCVFVCLCGDNDSRCASASPCVSVSVCVCVHVIFLPAQVNHQDLVCVCASLVVYSSNCAYGNFVCVWLFCILFKGLESINQIISVCVCVVCLLLFRLRIWQLCMYRVFFIFFRCSSPSPRSTKYGWKRSGSRPPPRKTAAPCHPSSFRLGNQSKP